MRYRITEEIDATPESVWRVLVDVSAWPSWLPTTNEVNRLDLGPFGFDSSARVHQPRLPKSVWRVTEFEPGRRFEWATSAPGVTTRGDHLVEPLDGGRTRVTLTTETTGALAGLVDLVYGRLTRRYVELEAHSLKRHCETTHPTP